MGVRNCRVSNIREAAAYFLKEPMRHALESRLGDCLPLPALVPGRLGICSGAAVTTGSAFAPCADFSPS